MNITINAHGGPVSVYTGAAEPVEAEVGELVDEGASVPFGFTRPEVGDAAPVGGIDHTR